MMKGKRKQALAFHTVTLPPPRIGFFKLVTGIQHHHPSSTKSTHKPTKPPTMPSVEYPPSPSSTLTPTKALPVRPPLFANRPTAYPRIRSKTEFDFYVFIWLVNNVDDEHASDVEQEFYKEQLEKYGYGLEMQVWLVLIIIVFFFRQLIWSNEFAFLSICYHPQRDIDKVQVSFCPWPLCHFINTCKMWWFVLLWGLCFKFCVTLLLIGKRSFILICKGGLLGKLCKCKSFSIIGFFFRQLIWSDEFEFLSICCYILSYGDWRLQSYAPIGDMVLPSDKQYVFWVRDRLVGGIASDQEREFYHNVVAYLG